MKSGLFITGTDTGIGKTVVSAFLLNAMISDKKNTLPAYFKPIQTGDEEDSDSRTILNLTTLDKKQICPPVYSLKAPLSPDRAAKREGVEIDIDKIVDSWRRLKNTRWIVEGAGGIEVPITGNTRMADLISLLDIPTLIISSTRLGTINHTLLTVSNLEKRGIPIAGIVLAGDEDKGLKECLENQSGQQIVAQIPRLESVDRKIIAALAEEFFRPSLINRFFNKTTKAPQPHTKNIWHPFTQHGLNVTEKKVSSAKGNHLFLADGNTLIDGISSWWVNLHGHAHPVIVKAITEQSSILEHVIFSGFTHAPAEKLAQYLVDATGQALPKVFFSDNGSTAVEVACKMAFQYQMNIGQNTRTCFLALKNSYHGDTLGAMSVSDPEGYHKVFKPLMPSVDFVEPDDFSGLEKLIRQNHYKYAAMIVEPLVQGAGGMNIYSKEYLSQAAKLCQEHDILLICDEVFTGFYRTGKCFAYQHTDISPDLLCLSKGITGGFLPLSATLATEKIYSAFLSQDISHAFLHGHSYTANPIACAAAVASWELLQSLECQENIQLISQITKERIQALASRSQVVGARTLGTIGALNIKNGGTYFSGDFSLQFRNRAMEKGVLLRPLGPVIYTLPPYCTSETDLHKVYDVIEEIL